MTDAYAFNAALYCDDCGAAIVADLKAKGTEDTGDSGDFPQGPFPDGGGEADSPHHCDDCGTFLENPLTDEGVEYTKGLIAEHFENGRGRADVLKEWADFYDLPFEPPFLFASFNRFEIKMPREAMEDCSHSGSCDADVEHWAPILKPLNPGIDPKAIRAELEEYGAWEAKDLEDEDQNWARIVWIAASNLKEEN